jgi:transposase
MPKPYSEDLRRKIVEAYDAKRGSQRALAAAFGVSLTFVQNLMKLRKQTHSITPRPHGGGQKPRFDQKGLATLREAVTLDPDATLDELCDRMAEKVNVRVSNQSMSRILRKLDLPRKKSRSTLRSGTPSA